MCMLSYYPPGIMPDARRLQNGNDVNRDGYGFAIVTRRRELIVKRGMDADMILEDFLDARATHPDGPALFHSRFATSGKVDISGCHPFTVGRDSRTVVAHNGVLFDPGKDSPSSDTAIFARHILPQYGIDKPSKLARLERFLGPSNKIVILTVNPARRKSSYVINADRGYWVDGEWHSNRDYEESRWKSYSALGWLGNDSEEAWDWKPRPDREPFPCEVCGMENSVDTLTFVCDACKSCQDCHMDSLTECMCYYGYGTKAKAITAGD